MIAVKNFLPKGSTTSFREVWRRMAGFGGSPARTACAVGLGIAIGLMPIAPLQTLTAIGLAFLFRLNRLAVLGGTLVWQPFTAPFIYAAEYGLGRWLSGGGAARAPGGAWESAILSLMLGGVLVALAGGAVVGLAVFFVLSRRTRQKAGSSVLEGEEG